MPDNPNRALDDALADSLGRLEIADAQPERVPPPLHYIPIDTSMFDPPPPRRGYGQPPRFVWEMVRTVVPVPWLSPSW